MKYVSLTCPNCGAAARINAEKCTGFCEYCGSPLTLDEEKPKVKLAIDDAEEAGYKFEKGRLRAQQEVRNGSDYVEPPTQSIRSPKSPKKRKTWLWVLGWVFCFPIPLTVLIWRSQKMKPVVKILLTALLWITVFAIGSSSEDTQPPSSSNASIATSESDIASPSGTSGTNKTVEDSLSEFFLGLSSETSRNDVEALAKQYGLYSAHKNKGTGTYVYRVAGDKKVADVNYPEKGSVVTISFNSLQNDAVTEITYFNTDLMIEGFWYPDTSVSESGYWLADYNDPSITYSFTTSNGNERNVSIVPVASSAEIVNYTPSYPSELNLLEKLFVQAYEGMTEDELKTFINENGLAYNSRGPGNEDTVAYTSDLTQKYGSNGSSGTTLRFDATGGIITRIRYYYSPAYYRDGIVASFYSKSYPYSHDGPFGFQTEVYEGKTVPYDDPIQLIKSLHSGSAATATPSDPISESSKVLYDVDEIINDYLVLFNKANPDSPIAGSDLSVYHHHGSDHTNQAKLSYGGFDVTISSSTYKKGIEVVINRFSSERKEASEWKDMFIRFGKAYRPTLTNAELEEYWHQIETDTIHSGKFNEFEFSSRWYSNGVELMELNGHLE